jgi:YidC/Oxa1 family membrane protein insertase
MMSCRVFSVLRGIGEEIRSIYRFYQVSRARGIEIVFYAEDAAAWPYMEGLVEHLTESRGLGVCYVTSDMKDPLFFSKNENLHVFYVRSLLAFFTLTLRSKLLLMTMPDLHMFHVRRSEFGTHHVYLFHNIGSSFPVVRFGALFHYDTIFCVGPHHREEIRRQEELYGLPRKNLVEFGYYKVERVYEEYMRMAGSMASAPASGRLRVLIAPSWGDDSILNLCGRELVSALLELQCEVIVRPHPVTVKKSPEVLRALNDEFGSRKGYLFEADISSSDSFYTSDVLISDWSGVAYEYAFGTERPVLFLDVPRKTVNHRAGELGIRPVDEGLREKIGLVLGTDEVQRVGSAVRELVENREGFREEILKARSEYVYSFGRSSEVGGEFLTSFLEGRGPGAEAAGRDGARA